MNEQFSREQALYLRARELGYDLRKSLGDGAIYRDGTYTGESKRDRGG
jgi:hypothetical protein